MKKFDKSIELPLYEFFTKLQAYDAHLKHQTLGVDAYLQLIEILSKGYGLLNQTALYGLCKRIWLKPYHDELFFKDLFNQYLSNKLETIRKAGEVEQLDKPDFFPKNDEKNLSNHANHPRDSSEKDELLNNKENNERKLLDSAITQEQQKLVLKFKAGTSAEQKYLRTDHSDIKTDIYSKVFRLNGKYSSISARKIEQALRSLRREQRAYTKKKLDISSTIDRIAQQGYLDKIVTSYGTKVLTQISLLIDKGGSMVGFSHLIDLLEEKVQKVSDKNTALYYFRNCPINILYNNKAQTLGITLEDFKLKNKNSLIILSDAGAARGRTDKERIEATQRFLDKIGNLPMVWINPVPKYRWVNNSASYIAEMIPMYEATDVAFINAIKRLK